MRDANAVGRLQLKSKLLIGVAGLAAAASSAAAAEATSPAPSPAADPKWLPYAEIGGGIGNGFAQGKVDLFAPVWQDMDSLLFVRLGAGTRTHDDRLLNFGIGYRTKINPDWILGVFGGIDNTQTDLGQNFSQYSLGVEAMSADWDVRANAYDGKHHSHTISDSFQLYIHDTQIAILQAQQAALSGFDGEVGYRIFHTENTDVRLFAGGYSFQNRHHVRETLNGQDFDFKYRSMTGLRGRAEVNVFDVDVLGSQSRVSFDGEVSHDKVRGTSGFAGVTLRIPLGAVWGQGGQALDDLDRRMADPVRRQDNVLTQWQFNKSEPVIIYAGQITSQPTNTLYYVSDTTPGEGSYADPTTLNDATGRDAVNQFVVVTDFGGDVGASNAHVHGGETIVAGGQTFHVRGVNSGQVFVHDFAPNSGTPTVVPVNPGDDLLNVEAGGVIIQGLHFAGDFGTAIYGHNIDQLAIFDIAVDGTGGGQYGVKIKQDVSGDLNLHLTNSTIDGVAQDGFYVQSILSDGGTSEATVEITGSSITGSGNIDAIMVGAVSNGSTLTQHFIVDPTLFSGGNYAILVSGTADGATLHQDISLTDVTVNDVTNSGIYIYANGYNGGEITQHITMDNVHITGAFSSGGEGGGGEGELAADAVTTGGYAYGNLITLAAASTSGATVDQIISLSDIHATGAYYDEIMVAAYAGDGGLTHQYSVMSGIFTTNSLYGDGVHVDGYAIGSGTVIQRVAANNITSTGNYGSGVIVSAVAGQLEEEPDVSVVDSDASIAVVAQYVVMNDATLTNNSDGFTADGRAAGFASLLQDVKLTRSNLSSNYYGLEAHILVAGAASGQQIVSLIGDKLNSNEADGADFDVTGLREGFASQTVYIDHTNLLQNGADGMYASAVALFGGDAEQNIGVYNSTLTNNAHNGIELQTFALGYDVGFDNLYYYSHVTSNLIVGGSQLSHNGLDGVHVENLAQYGGQVDQFIYLYNDLFNLNARDGVHEETAADSVGFYGYSLGTAAYSDLYVVDSHADHNGQLGIYVGAHASSTYDPSRLFGATYLIQHVVVQGSEANHNGIGGFSAVALDEGLFSLNIQYVTLDSSHFDSNELFGAGFLAQQYFGPGSFGAAIQDVAIVNSDLSHNGRYGLAGLADASGFQGRAEQNFNIADSHFNQNGVDGIYLYRHAHDGFYYSYTYEDDTTISYPCNSVQGLGGGCAFVRQTVQIVNSEANNNGHDGIYVKTVADNYGAVYSSSGRPYDTPTLVLVGTDVSHNGYHGLDMNNDIGVGSYLYQYALAINSHFDHNGVDGIFLRNVVHDEGFVGQLRTVAYEYDGGTYYYTYLYPGSKLTLYNSTASYNGANGIELFNDVSSGSLLYQYVQFINSHADHNHGYGITANNYVTSGSVLLQSILLYTYVPEGTETFAAVTTTVSHNGYGGIQIFGYANEVDTIFNTLQLSNVQVNDNGHGSEYAGDGVSMTMYSAGTYIARQSFHAEDSQFNGNAGFGAGLLDVSVYDRDSSEQVIVSSGNHFDNNNQAGLGAAMIASGTFAIQALVSDGDSISGNATGGLVQYAGFTNSSLGLQLSRISNGTFLNDGMGPLPDGIPYVDITYGNGILVVMDAVYSSAVASQYIAGNTLDGIGANGIDVEILSFNRALVYDSSVIAQNSVSNAGGDGVFVWLEALGYGDNGSQIYTSLDGGIVVSGNMIEHAGYGENGGSGIDVALTVGLSGVIDSYGDLGYPGYLLPIHIDGNSVTGAYDNGIVLTSNNLGGFIGTRTEIGYGGSNSVTDVGGLGIGVVTYTGYGLVPGFTVAETDIEHNVVTAAGLGGIAAVNITGYGTVHSYLDITYNSVYGPSLAGIAVADVNGFGGVILDSVSIGANDIHGAGLGIGVFDTSASQTSHISDNNIYGDATSYGIEGDAYGTALQTIYVYDNNNSQTGIPAANQYYFYAEPGAVQLVF